MRSSTIVTILLAYTSFTLTVHAAETPPSRWQPDALVVQFAGNIGVFAAGIEKRIGSSSWYGDLLLGYAPASITGVDVYAAAAKLNYRLPWTLGGNDNRLTPYGGLMLSYYFGKDYRSSTYTPSGYYLYPANQWHLSPFIGLRLNAPSSATPEIALYAELGIHDVYLSHWYNNRDYLDLNDVINLAIGLSVPLD